MEHAFIYDTKIGKIKFAEDGIGITEITLVSMDSPEDRAFSGGNAPEKKGIIKETELIRKAFNELSEYLVGSRTEFSVPLNPKGTEFQQRVWKVLQTIPYGETRSYGQVAKEAGNAKAARAVGMANNKNPVLIMIPCHRVIGANGNLTGYGGGLPLKELLLNLEKGKVM